MNFWIDVKRSRYSGGEFFVIHFKKREDFDDMKIRLREIASVSITKEGRNELDRLLNCIENQLSSKYSPSDSTECSSLISVNNMGLLFTLSMAMLDVEHDSNVK